MIYREKEKAREVRSLSLLVHLATTAYPLPAKEKNLALLIQPPRALHDVHVYIPVAKTGLFFFHAAIENSERE